MPFSHARKRSFLLHGTKWVAIAAGVTSTMLGLTVVIGWYAHLPTLIQLHPAFAPMQFNTALGMIIGGLALFFLAFKRKTAAMAAGGVLCLFSMVTFLQYPLNTNFGLDRLFFDPYIATQTSHAGRMSPITSICFSLIGLTACFAGIKGNPGRRPLIVGLLSSIIIAFAFMAVLGYITGLTGTYGWGQLTRVAFHTALGLGLLGLGLFATAWREEINDQHIFPRWLPGPVALALLTSSVILWQALVDQHNVQVARIVQADASTAVNRLAARMESRLQAIIRMAQRWEFARSPLREAWEADARNYVKDFPGFQAIEWVDPSYHIRWIVPMEGNEAALNLDLTAEDRRRKTVKNAQERGTLSLTMPVDLFQGGRGFLAYTPINSGTNFLGFIVGVFRTQNLFTALLPPGIATDYSIVVYAGDEKLFERHPAALPPRPDWISESAVELHGAKWNVKVWPTPQWIARQQSKLPPTMLAVGIFSSLLLSLTVFLAQKAHAKAVEKEEANLRLNREIHERRRAEEKLREANVLQSAILNGADFSIISTTPDGTIASFNAAAERMLGYKAEEVVGKVTPSILHDKDEVIQRAKWLSAELGKNVEPGFETFVASARIKGVDEREWTYIHKDGSRFPVLLSVTALSDGAGGIQGFLGIAVDLTERKKSAEQLREREERFRQAFENTPIGMTLVSTKGEWLRVNPSMCRILGYSEVELLAMDFQSITHPDDLKENLAYFEKMMSEEIDSYHMEKRYMHKQGHVVYASLHVSLVKDEFGHPLYFISQIKDITERKAAEAAREKLLRELQEALAEVKTLSGLLPICGRCKRVRDDGGYWNQIETYIAKHTEASFTHGVCPDCAIKELEAAGIKVSDKMRAAAGQKPKE